GTFSFTYTYSATTTFSVMSSAPDINAAQITCTFNPNPLVSTGVASSTTVTMVCSTQGVLFGHNISAPNQVRPEDMPLVAGIAGIAGLPLLGMLLLPTTNKRMKKLKIM